MQKTLVTPLIEECTETVEEVKLAKITLAENENSHKSSSCTAYIVLMLAVFIICAGITTFFITIDLWLKIMFRALSLAPVLRQRFNKLINVKSETN